LAIAMPIIVCAATTQSAVDELLAADRAFSAASATTDLVSGLSAMFADDVVIPNPPGQFAGGKAAVVCLEYTGCRSAGQFPVLHDLAATSRDGTVALRRRVRSRRPPHPSGSRQFLDQVAGFLL
jgi:ketosteroid isomerase-like protein